VHSLDDTIVAVSTPAGPSPRAIVRLSGPEAFPLLERLLAEPASLAALPWYCAREARLRLHGGGPGVPATLYLMRAPRSYTRQHVAEVHTLGSPPLLRMLLDAFVERGARIAEPGEFTRRAFLAGRIDLAQAEAVLAVIQAGSVAEHRAAARALQGLASRRIHELHGRLVGLRALVEASIDFAEHDIELVSSADVLAGVDDALAIVAGELKNADAGVLPPEGIRVALCGLPNAGKSSLFNALLGRPRAIVTPIPGTTRDAVAEPLTLDGIRFRLYDTAGLAPNCGMRNAECGIPPAIPPSPSPSAIGAGSDASSDHASRVTRHACTLADPIATEAITRSRGLIAGTHIALVVLDASQPLTRAERDLWHEVHAPHKLLLLNKSDLPSAISDAHVAEFAPDAAVIRTSAVTGEGLDALKRALAGLVQGGRVEATPSDLIWNARHREALRKAREALGRARQAVGEGMGEEFVAADLRDAHDALGAITGQVAPDDLLDLIFAQFCIGK